MQEFMMPSPDGALPEAAQLAEAQRDDVLNDDAPIDDAPIAVEQVVVEPIDDAPIAVEQVVVEPIEAIVTATTPAVRVIPLDRSFAFNHCLTYAYFVQDQPDGGRLLEQRYGETRLLPALQDRMVNYPDTLSVLALVDGEDPDTVAVLPIIARLIDTSSHVQLRVLAEDEDLTPLAMLATDLDVNAGLEEWDLPQFFVFDEEWELQGQWGPRPAAAERNLETWLARYPGYEALAEDESDAGLQRFAELTHKLIQEMRIWYNSGLAADCQTEFCELLASLQVPDDADEGDS